MRHAILLPPSKGQVSGGRGAPWTPDGSVLDADRDVVMRSLVSSMQRSSGATLTKVLDARGDTLDAARATNRLVASAPTMPAIVRYDGVLYGELGYAALPAPARRRLDRSVLIFSALHGVVGARDPLPEHRLGFGASLDGLGRLSTWWRPELTAALAPRVEGAVVWDLLPAEHEAAIDWGGLDPRRRVTVRFLDASGRTVSHWNKLLKGSLVRWLAETGATDPARVAELRHAQGYRLDLDASEDLARRVDVVLAPGANPEELRRQAELRWAA